MDFIHFLLLVYTYSIFFQYSASNLPYFIDEHQNCNNVYNATNPGTSTKYVAYLGEFATTTDCISACLSYSISARCETYTYYTSSFNSSSPFYKQCYGRFNYPLWIAVTQKRVDCGRVIWNCSTNLDCSLNGDCNRTTFKCDCNPSWSGYHCETLKLLPAKKSAGYKLQADIDGLPTSSWGGIPIIDYNDSNPSTKYHMIVSEFINHCGVDSWVTNSRIIRAQSTNGWNSKYIRKEVLFEPFAHEPDIIYANGYYIMYYTHFNYSTWHNLTYCNCSDGSTNRELCNNKHDNIPYNPYYITSMRYAESIYGPWSEAVDIFNISWNEPNGTHDNNFAAIVLSNGSLIGMKRNWIHTEFVHGSEIHLVTASQWKDNDTYLVHDEVLFPELNQPFTEDPYLYLDCDGNYHALFHNMDPGNHPQVCGAHAFSENGLNWIYAGVAYNSIIEYDDGTTFVAPRKERPHFLFDDKDHCTPIAISWGVVYGGMYGDACYTHIQPV